MTHEYAIEATNALSVAYMSPETIRDGTVDSKSDMWALGCIVFQVPSPDLLSGGAPGG